jgi:hypothetical protein
MRSNVARRFRAAGGPLLFTSPISVPALPASLVRQTEGWVKSELTKVRLDAAVGVAFLIMTFMLSGWFYYLLFQALRG